jgi:hypothetical protein
MAVVLGTNLCKVGAVETMVPPRAPFFTQSLNLAEWWALAGQSRLRPRTPRNGRTLGKTDRPWRLSSEPASARKSQGLRSSTACRSRSSDAIAFRCPARNGAGKTTLLRILAGETDLHGGELAREKGTRIAFHDQRPSAAQRSRNSLLRLVAGHTKPVRRPNHVGRFFEEPWCSRRSVPAPFRASVSWAWIAGSGVVKDRRENDFAAGPDRPRLGGLVAAGMGRSAY